MKEFILESPKKGNEKSKPHRSDWVREDETRRLSYLLGKGWRVVEEREYVAPVAAPDFIQVERTPEETDETRLTATAFEDGFADLSAEQGAALRSADFGTVQSLRDASDDDLRAVPGIGPAAVRNIRKALVQPGAEPEE